jgi:2'-5' RNA ligase
MARYSITLNFFIPRQIIKEVKKEELGDNFIFDWRKEGFFHCTVKAIELSDNLPSKEHLNSLILKASEVFSKQAPFNVIIGGVDKFPDVFYAKVNSPYLKELHKKLCNTGLPSNRPEFEGENYIPHASLVSLANPSFRELNTHHIFGDFIVKEIQLVLWDIPNGHKPLICHRFKLKNSK